MMYPALIQFRRKLGTARMVQLARKMARMAQKEMNDIATPVRQLRNWSRRKTSASKAPVSRPLRMASARAMGKV